jgi:uncharacterized membrane protein YgdD (TMEM256/DUF423 family)
MWIHIASAFGFLGVALGAFGAHALKARLGEYLPTWQTAVLYHLIHAVVILALALYAKSGQNSVTLPATLFSMGIFLFSGSLYGLSLSGIKILGAITPIGGLCFLAGWAAIAWRLKP